MIGSLQAIVICNNIDFLIEIVYNLLIMSDAGGIQPFDGGEGIELSFESFSTGVPFDLAKVEARQDDIDGILASFDDQSVVSELNRKMASDWDDDFGISYTHIAGRSLPGLQIHGIAEKVAFSANDMTGADFESAQLTASIFTGSILRGANLKGATLDSVVAPLSIFEEAELHDVSAIDIILNFARVNGMRGRGLNIVSSYLIGTQGISEEMLREFADISAARLLIPPSQDTESKSLFKTLGKVLSNRFSDVNDKDLVKDLDPVEIVRNFNLAKKLVDQKRLEGMVFDDVILTEARMAGRQMAGTVWNSIHGRGLTLRATKASGLVVFGSQLQDGDFTSLWAPGMFAVNTSFRDTPTRNANLGGSIFYQTDLTGVDLEDTNLDGVVIIGGSAPELSDYQKSHVRIASLEKLPELVATNISRFGGQLALGSNDQQHQPEITE